MRSPPTPTSWSTFWADRRGAAALEAALTLPILAMLILGTIECGRLLHLYNSLRSATDEAGRHALAHIGSCGTTAVDVLRARLPDPAASATGTVATDATGLTLCTMEAFLTVPLAGGIGGHIVVLNARSVVPLGAS